MRNSALAFSSSLNGSEGTARADPLPSLSAAFKTCRSTALGTAAACFRTNLFAALACFPMLPTLVGRHLAAQDLSSGRTAAPTRYLLLTKGAPAARPSLKTQARARRADYGQEGESWRASKSPRGLGGADTTRRTKTHRLVPRPVNVPTTQPDHPPRDHPEDAKSP